jgi:autotransporter passenger strand-loop-strand repeat protein
MSWLKRPIQQASDLPGFVSPSAVRREATISRRRPPRAALDVAELEDRVVPTLLGQQLFPSDNPWNQNISNAPLASNSAQIIAHIGVNTRLTPDWYADNPANGSAALYGIPFNVVHGNSTAKISVKIDNYPGESDVTPVPIPANAVIEGDFQNGPNPNGGGYIAGQRGDSHLLIWDEDNNVAYELYGVTRPADTKLFPNTNGVELAHTDGLWHAAQETVWNMNTNTFRALGETSADAAGLSILAGLVRPDEGLPVSQGGQGVINHALRVTLPSGEVNPQYVYPASHIVGVSQGANNLPLGGRMRLANTPAVNALISNMPPESQIIARAMQQYGLIVADIGSAMYVTGTSATIDTVDSPNVNITWNLNDIFASNGLEALNAGDFQVVNLTPVATRLSAASGAIGSSITITGQNFSGAAGHLSVLFGASPATSVTIVDDSHVTAVVPSGSGTVNVIVQSGISETDNFSSNPSANVNKPIFGYGTSAVTSADQFTFGSQTISGATSTVSFATSTIVSGNTDLLTIVVKDTTGAAVAGLGNSAFNFNLAGGSSGGTFGAVAATSTPGTYTAVFTGTTAGAATTLTAAVSGVTLNTKPTVQVVVGSISGAKSKVGLAASTVDASHMDKVTIMVKDGAGNPITGLASSAFQLSLSGGTSAGTFGAVAETTTTGTYTVLFTGVSAGTASTLTTVVNGVALTSKPTITVNPGSTPVAPKITLNPSNQTVAVGGSVTFTAAASGTPAPTVQWQISTGGAFVNIAGATSPTYSFIASASQNGSRFRAVFTNSAGQAATSAATLTTTNGTTIGPGQQLVVSAGQTVTNVTILPGGYLLVLSGGTDIGTINDGGDETVEAGGMSIGATINDEGDIEVFGTATGLIHNSGYINVDAGGTVVNTIINADIMYVSAGGSAINTTIFTGGSTTVIGGGSTSGTILNGGAEWVRAGAVTNGTIVNNGGTEYVFGGGASNSLTLNNGANSTMLGAVNGATINQGGLLTVFDGGSANGAIVDNGALAFDLSTTNTFTGQVTGSGALTTRSNGKLVATKSINNITIVIGSSSSLELAAASNANITFGYQSTLKLDDSLGFTGAIAATPGYQDVLDLGDVPFVLGVTTVQFVENATHTQGVLTVSDAANGGPTVQLVLLGDFSLGTFTAAADSAATAQNPHPGALINGPF